MPKFRLGVSYRRLCLSTILIVLFCALSYLILAGMKGSSEADAASIPIDTKRLSAAETRRLGWDPERLDQVFAYSASLSTDTLMIVTAGRTVAAYGDTAQRYHVHSIRKAFLSALIGQHAGPGSRQIDLDVTLDELGIDDMPGPLTLLQKQASVRHLLMSMSGVNHAAAAEAGLTAEKNRRLGSEENRPGTVWAYNNWDYNILTTIFETTTKSPIAKAFQSGIAEAAGMQDFTPADVSYAAAPDLSQHRAAMFRMSARDLARFGEIYLSRGVLSGEKILPATWIDRIAADAVETGNHGLRKAHGYLWWLPEPDSGLPSNTFWAWGFGQQALFVIPRWNTVIVHQSDTTEFRKRFFALIRDRSMEPSRALETLALICQKPVAGPGEFCLEHRFILRHEFARLISLIADARREK